MSTLVNSIVELYEAEDLSPAQIGASLDLEEVAVKAALMQNSGKFRAINKELSKLNKECNGALQTLTFDVQNASLELEDSPEAPAPPTLVNELISDSELEEFMIAYKDLARSAQNEAVKERALKNLINAGAKITDGLGETEARKIIKDAGGEKSGAINLIYFNERLAAAKKLKQSMKGNLPLLEAING